MSVYTKFPQHPYNVGSHLINDLGNVGGLIIGHFPYHKVKGFFVKIINIIYSFNQFDNCGCYFDITFLLEYLCSVELPVLD